MNTGEKINIVKRKLWFFKYAVRDFSLIYPGGFDLLVEGKHRVCIGTPGKTPRQCDIYAQVEAGKVIFINQAGVKHKSPYAVFGRNKYQHNGKNTKKQNDRAKPDHKGEKEKAKTGNPGRQAGTGTDAGGNESRGESDRPGDR